MHALRSRARYLSMASGLLLALTISSACAQPQGGQIGGAGGSPEAQKPSRVIIASWAEIKILAGKLDRGSTYGPDFMNVVNSQLTVLDAQGGVQPRLAADLPSRDRGTWVVNADGTMATSWKLRPNALWHDGERVTARDIAFAFRVYADPEIVTGSSDPERFIDRVEALDDQTFVIRWKQIYPWAGQITSEALPEHLVGSLYEAGDKVAFQNNNFWSSPSYVSDGPYRIADWVQGSQLTFRAFDQYFLGRPKIDEVVFQITPDVNTVVAYLLSGAADVTVNTTMNQAAWAAVKPEWDRDGAGQIVSIPHHLRATQFQLDPSRLREPALLDVRVRRAMIYALDRTAIADAVSRGASPAADAMMSPNDLLFPKLQALMTVYAYDATKASSLFQEAGWTKRGDALVDSTGRRLTVEVMTTDMADNVTEMRIMADYLNRAGIDVTQTPVPEAQNRDNEFRAKFPSLTITGQGIDLPRSMANYSVAQCPTTEARYVGSNRGCWQDADFERSYRVATTSLDQNERADATLQALRAITEGVAVIPMSYNLDNVAVRKGLVGPGPRQAQGYDTWNIHEWAWK